MLSQFDKASRRVARKPGSSQSVTEGQGSVDDLQIKKLCHSAADNTILPSSRADTATRSLSGHLQSQPEGLQQCISAKRVPDPCRSVEKLPEFLPDCEKTPGPSQHLQVAQGMASIDGKEEPDAFNSRMEEKNPPPPKQVPTTAPIASSSNFNMKISHKLKTRAKARHQPRNLTARATGSQRFSRMPCKMYFRWTEQSGIIEKGGSQIKISEMISYIFESIPELSEAINDVKTHVSDKNSSICNNLKTNNLSMSQINETLVCFENFSRTIKTSNNENSFGNKIKKQSTIIQELTDKYSQFNTDEIIETRIKQAISTIKEENKSVLEDISKSFTEVNTYTIALKKCFDTSKEEISKLSMKLNKITSDDTRQRQLWKELAQTEDNHKTNVMT
ncbi:hypothetical protein O181_014991 [Austropuccinia psidii MF-1]|uniref:Uncharacterized protein n=1 Tax=Austropuccinia psidii MF-1 TaxID=1389203 RepID=A0A9Q3BZ58_9BASI|nr:hypothetical protein [Austropuccinia psidii MF-1]